MSFRHSSLAFSLAAYTLMTGGFGVLFLATVELLPTVIRGRGFGVMAACGRLGAVVGMQLMKFGPITSHAVLGVVALLTAATLSTLFETFRQPLTQTMDQLEKQMQAKQPTQFNNQTETEYSTKKDIIHES